MTSRGIPFAHTSDLTGSLSALYQGPWSLLGRPAAVPAFSNEIVPSAPTPTAEERFPMTACLKDWKSLEGKTHAKLRSGRLRLRGAAAVCIAAAARLRLPPVTWGLEQRDFATGIVDVFAPES